MSSHTQGPLHADGTRVLDVGQRVVGLAVSPWLPRGEQEGNARLWAVADDHALLLRLMVSGLMAKRVFLEWTEGARVVIRVGWERLTVPLDEFGCPVLTDSLRAALLKAEETNQAGATGR